MTEIIESVFDKPIDFKLSQEELAEALYSGSPHLEFLMDKLARHHRESTAVLPPWCAQPDSCKDFFRDVSRTMIKFSIEGDYIYYKTTKGE